MYDKKHLISVLEKNLKTEMKVIEFYLDNAEKLNYKENKKKIDILVFESFSHASMIVKEILELKKENSRKIDSKAYEKALAEEQAFQELYKYELKNTKDKEAKKMFEKLIKQEIAHEKIVKSLK